VQLAAPCESRAIPFDSNNIDLTGAWAGDDAGIYYLRQIDNVLWWNGMANRAGPAADLGREWNNVGRGLIDSSTRTIEVSWADVPRGGILGHGTLVLHIEADSAGNLQLLTVSQDDGGFGARIFTPCSPG
jgi:hypothetical protein